MDQNSFYILIGILVTVLGGVLGHTAMLWFKIGRLDGHLEEFSGRLTTLNSVINHLAQRIDALCASACDKKESLSDGTSGTNG